MQKPAAYPAWATQPRALLAAWAESDGLDAVLFLSSVLESTELAASVDAPSVA